MDDGSARPGASSRASCRSAGAEGGAWIDPQARDGSCLVLGFERALGRRPREPRALSVGARACEQEAYRAEASGPDRLRGRSPEHSRSARAPCALTMRARAPFLGAGGCLLAGAPCGRAARNLRDARKLFASENVQLRCVRYSLEPVGESDSRGTITPRCTCDAMMAPRRARRSTGAFSCFATGCWPRDRRPARPRFALAGRRRQRLHRSRRPGILGVIVLERRCRPGILGEILLDRSRCPAIRGIVPSPIRGIRKLARSAGAPSQTCYVV